MEYERLVRRQKEFFKMGKTKKPGFRIFYLRKLLKWMEENEDRILRALSQDLGKSSTEGYMTEIGMVKEEIRFNMKHLTFWAKPKRVKTPATQFPSFSFIYREPYGVVLIMAPWNYPFQLTVAPLIGAISAGNCAVLKPSSYSVHTSAMIQEMIREVFPSGYVTVVTGGREENEALLSEKFDYIFISSGSVSLFTDIDVCKKILWKMKELLKPGGKFVFAVDSIKDRCEDDEEYKTSIEVKTKEGFDLVLKGKNRFDEETNTQYSPSVYELYRGSELLQKEEMDFQTHLYELGELEPYLEEIGFSKVTVYCSYEKEIAQNNETNMFLYECSL